MERVEVVIDGRCLREGHPDAWRFGVVVPEEFPNPSLVLVECQPRGKERKVRRIHCAITWLLKDTPFLRARMSEAGLYPGFNSVY
jgi:hypothetical protein